MDTAILQVEKGRLVVLVPESLVANIEMMNKIYQMATREQREVFYLVLVNGDTEILAATRSAATLKALVSGGRFSSASRVVQASRWLSALREIYRPGDVIVCHAEQQVRGGFLRTVPASEFLRAGMQVPVRVISGFYHPVRTQIQEWLAGAVYWAGVLAIVGTFFFLEISLDQGLHGAARSALLIVLLLATLAAGIAWTRITCH